MVPQVSKLALMHAVLLGALMFVVSVHVVPLLLLVNVLTVTIALEDGFLFLFGLVLALVQRLLLLLVAVVELLLEMVCVWTHVDYF